jgi:hypothetical protein
LARNDDRGVDQLLKASDLDHDLDEHVCATVAAYYRRNGRSTDARKIEKRFRERAERE